MGRFALPSIFSQSKSCKKFESLLTQARTRFNRNKIMVVKKKYIMVGFSFKKKFLFWTKSFFILFKHNEQNLS
jgi:hypothetical protein